MTKVVDIAKVNNSVQAVIALTEDGDEVVLEKDGSPLVRIIPLSEKSEQNGKRVLGLGGGQNYFMSDDFDDELPEDFWGFEND